MRRPILLSLFVLLCLGVAHDVSAQRRGGMAPGFSRGGYGFNRARSVPRYRTGNAYLPYDSGFGYPYDNFDSGTPMHPSRPFIFSSRLSSFSRPRRPSSRHRCIQ